VWEKDFGRGEQTKFEDFVNCMLPSIADINKEALRSAETDTTAIHRFVTHFHKFRIASMRGSAGRPRYLKHSNSTLFTPK
jgi:hypothetical protein